MRAINNTASRLISLAAATLLLAGAVHAAPAVYSNGPVVGLDGLSVLAPTEGTFGFGTQLASGNAMADDFTVAAGDTWNVSSISLFAYQTGASSFTFTTVDWRIVSGDVNTGTVLASGSTAAQNEGLVGYRVTSTTLTNTQRPIYQIGVDIPDLVLTGGDYWLSWSIGGTLGSGPWTPHITNDLVANAVQRTAATGSFNTVIDSGSQRTVELPFQLNGTVPEPTSLALVLAAGLAAIGAQRRRAA